MAEKPLSFAIVGCGRISQVHLAVLDGHPGVELAAVVDIDLQAAEGAAEAWGCKAFGDIVSMLEEVRPDAVVLCTPPNTHRELAENALDSGAHVLCEKPLALALEDAAAMMETAERSSRQLMMASKFRYVKDIVKARSILKSGLLGEALCFENIFCASVDMSGRWNADPRVGGGGVLVDNGTHSVDILRYLLGPIQAVHAVEAPRWQTLEVEDSCHLLCRLKDETLATIDLSWSVNKITPWYISVYGSEGVLQVGWAESRYRTKDKENWISFGSGYEKFGAVAQQLQNFMDVIGGRDEPLIDRDAAMESVKVIQAAYRSMSRGAWEIVES